MQLVTISLLSIPQILFIIITAIVVILALTLLIVLPLRKRYKKTNFREYYYKKVYKIAFDEDYYLINDFLFRIDDNNVAVIDHILFADKYIYLINDYLYEGDLTGNQNDKSLILINMQGKKFYTDNPIILSDKIATRLSIITGIDKSLLIGLTLVNNECRVSLEQTDKRYYIVQRNKLDSLIKAIESRNVGKINAEEMANTVQALNKLNRRKKK